MLSFGWLEAKVSFYTDNECSHIQIDDMRVDRNSENMKLALKLINKGEYNCWDRSKVRQQVIGKRIDEDNVFELINWILQEDVERDLYVKRRRRHVHLEASELHPCILIPVYEKHKGSALLSVGTERGFIGAALSKASQLYLVDNTPDVAVYNYIIYVLLRVSGNYLDFLYLRKKASCDEWIRAFENKNLNIRGDVRRYVPYLWEFWNKNVRLKEKSFESIEVNNTKEIPYLISSDSGFYINLQRFANANYLYDEELFSWVKYLADSDQIFIYLADVSNYDQLKEVIEKIYPDKFGIIDFSNIIGLEESGGKLEFRSRYLDEIGHRDCIEAFKDVADEETMIVWTVCLGVIGIQYEDNIEELKVDWGRWVYRAASLEQILSFSLGERLTVDIWKSELTNYEGCRVGIEELSIFERMNNFLLALLRG